jgi:hypothetical protein
MREAVGENEDRGYKAMREIKHLSREICLHLNVEE